jgi:hypothetical protein
MPKHHYTVTSVCCTFLVQVSTINVLVQYSYLLQVQYDTLLPSQQLAPACERRKYDISREESVCIQPLHLRASQKDPLIR